MKKAIVLLTVSTMVGVVGIPKAVNASSWHKGLPNSLKYTKWHRGSDKITFGKKAFSFWGPDGAYRFGIPQTNVRYKYLGNHRYALKRNEPHYFVSNEVSYITHLSRTKFYWKADKSSPTLVYRRY